MLKQQSSGFFEMIKLKQLILNCFSILFLLSSSGFCPPKPRGKTPQSLEVVKYTPKTLQPKILVQPKRHFFTNDPTFAVLISNQRALLTVFGNNLIIALKGRTIILEDLLNRPQTDGFCIGTTMLLDNCEISMTTSNTVPGALKVTGNIVPFIDPQAFFNATSQSSIRPATRLILNQENQQPYAYAPIRHELMFPIPQTAILSFLNFDLHLPPS